ncbi:hypothetical protein A2V95_02465 [Candidatus Kuenenbacteria bacterium RBG_16_41_7]|uniref:Uncharacterized protein n=1 Tax=Candidatus Kuenenbacteria bacterium RBG_16_41_7 TaxID=1798560 RepID=A0A1F6GCU6_9BACT|nr:MAG: hypothetical protein A2V95_02465 [Candidatus Kuenenbacteria bacterium RBG_16_41_7]
MRNKKLATILVIAFVAVLAALGAWMFFGEKQTDNPVNINIMTNGDNNQQLPSSNGVNGLDNQQATGQDQKQPPVISQETEALNRAKFFVEMIGSYSPGARFQNVIDLQPMMSDKMLVWWRDFMERNQASLEDNQESITTKVFKTNPSVLNENIASFTFTARRTKLAGENQISYSQEAEVEMVKDQGTWKVNNLIWR